MNRDFMPSKQAELRVWLLNFATRITAAPVPLGLTATQATAFTALQVAYDAAYLIAVEPSTRTKGTIAAKNLALKNVKANARFLAKIIQAAPGVTPTQKIDLGLNPHDVEPTPINPPTDSPVLKISAVNGRRLSIRLSADDSEKRGKPPGVAGASIFSFVGEVAPSSAAGWYFQGNTTRTTFDVEFAATVPAGSQVWIAAFWYNPRGMSGPACEPVSGYLASGVILSQAA